MKHPRHGIGFRSHTAGFTLLEILVAMTLFAIAATTLFASFNQMTATIFPLTQKEKRYTQAHTLLQRITLDLMTVCLTPEGAYVPPEIFDDRKRDRYRISAGTTPLSGRDYSFISFTSHSHLPIQDDLPPLPARINYYIDTADNGTATLKRGDTPIVFLGETDWVENDNGIPVCENVLEFDIQLIDQEGTRHDTWDSDSDGYHYATPRAVVLTLKTGVDEDWDLFTTTVFLGVYRENHEI